MEVDRKLFFLLFFFCYKFVGTSCSPVAPQRTDPSFLFIIRIHHFLLEKNSMFPPCSFPFIFEETQAHKTKTEEQSKAHSALIWQRGKGTKTAFIVENSAWSFPPIKKKKQTSVTFVGNSGSEWLTNSIAGLEKQPSSSCHGTGIDSHLEKGLWCCNSSRTAIPGAAPGIWMSNSD